MMARVPVVIDFKGKEYYCINAYAEHYRLCGDETRIFVRKDKRKQHIINLSGVQKVFRTLKKKELDKILPKKLIYETLEKKIVWLCDECYNRIETNEKPVICTHLRHDEPCDSTKFLKRYDISVNITAKKEFKVIGNRFEQIYPELPKRKRKSKTDNMSFVEKIHTPANRRDIVLDCKYFLKKLKVTSVISTKLDTLLEHMLTAYEANFDFDLIRQLFSDFLVETLTKHKDFVVTEYTDEIEDFPIKRIRLAKTEEKEEE